ncbi:MAG: glucosaminidase domain-containing protein [Bacteroidales bacterium]|nr:glucosaminidase domain-containing protein [Bacteroidales bacterium]
MILTLFMLSAAVAQTPAARITPEAYIQEYSALAVSEMRRSGIPASITLAQALLESDAGNSVLAVQGRNHFGIKCHGDWTGARIYKDDDSKDECFRVYAKAADSYADHTDFLRYGRRYANLFSLERTDYKGWAEGLQDCGYATSRKYARQLTDLIERYGLHRFDLEGTAAPASPATETAAAVAELPPSPAQERGVYAEEFSFRPGSRTFRQNGVLCLRALPGETFSSIAQAYNLFDWELRAFNRELGQDDLTPGAIVYLARRKKSRR